MTQSIECLGQLDEAEKLMDDFVAKSINLSQKFSVLCREEGMTAKERDGVLDVSTSDRVFRLMSDEKSGFSRLDMRSHSAFGQEIFEHYLKQPKGHSFAFGLVQANFPDFNSLPTGVGTRGINRLCNFDMPAIAIANHVQMNGGMNFYMSKVSEEHFFHLDVVGEKKRVVYVSYEWGKTYGKFTFDRFEDEMLPVKAQWYETTGAPIEHKHASKEKVKNWKLFLSTETTWRKTEKYGFVPGKVDFLDDQSGRTKQTELQFEDWLFEDDVDLTLLAPEKFNKEELLKEVHFDRWESKFNRKELR
jgi:hypothetical protein